MQSNLEKRVFDGTLLMYSALISLSFMI